jgi:hypothetical protein
MARKLVTAAAALALALVVAGCGSDGDSGKGDGADGARGDTVRHEVSASTKPVTVSGYGDTKERQTVKLQLQLDNHPVSGVVIRQNTYRLAPTADDGSFSVRVDATSVRRTQLSVADASNARLVKDGDARKLTASERRDLEAWQGGVDVAFAVKDLQVSEKDDLVFVTGQLVGQGIAPLRVSLFGYRLRGTLQAPGGNAGYRVSTRSEDREIWSLASETDKDGAFSGTFLPRTGDSDLNVEAYKGADVWMTEEPNSTHFEPLSSAVVTIKLDDMGMLSVDDVKAEPGAIYEGVLVGVADGDQVIKPQAATWPTDGGAFTLIYRKGDLAGDDMQLWQSQRYVYQDNLDVRPGGSVDMGGYPDRLEPADPRGLAHVTAP